MKNLYSEYLVADPLALEVVWNDSVIERIHLLWSKGITPAKKPRHKELATAFYNYVQGEYTIWPDLPLALDTIPGFSHKILTTLQEKVTYGKIITYVGLAKLAGEGRKARAVGQVMARNKWPLIIPCHRVVAQGGDLRGFSGASGLDMKAWLLKLEKAKLPQL